MWPTGGGSRAGDSMTPDKRREIARKARRQAGGFIDGCSADLVGSGPEATKLCPVCEAIERVAVIAITAALAEERERDCRAVCPYCRDARSGYEQRPVLKSGYWLHANEDGGWVDCRAAAIRAGEESDG